MGVGAGLYMYDVL